MTEPLNLPPTLHIEHVLPQAWHANWPVQGEEAVQRRAHHVHLLGNLTLVTSKLNASLSHAAWSAKRQALNAHSVLMMNRQLVDSWPEEWNEDAIEERSRDISKIICRVWPGPQGWHREG
jgi:hypothetical protein